MAVLKMICTDDGYAITDECGTMFITFSVSAGRRIYMDAYRDPHKPDLTSIFLRGVLVAHDAMRGE